MRKKIVLSLRKKKLVFLKGPESVGQVINISESGMMLVSQDKINKKDALDISIKSRDFIYVKNISGKTIWVKKVTQGNQTYYKSGIEFLKLNTEQKDILDRFAYERDE